MYIHHDLGLEGMVTTAPGPFDGSAYTSSRKLNPYFIAARFFSTDLGGRRSLILSSMMLIAVTSVAFVKMPAAGILRLRTGSRKRVSCFVKLNRALYLYLIAWCYNFSTGSGGII